MAVSTLSEHNLLIFLLQLVILLFAARGAGELFRALKQPALIGEILVGAVFGPTILGRFLPGVHGWLFPNNPLQHSMLETVSWLGIFFLLLATGFEVNIATAWKQRRSALSVGVIGVLIPMAMGIGLAFLLPDKFIVAPDRKLIFVLFLGTAVAISAMAVISRVLHDLDILKTDIGATIISAVTVNDVLGWVAFTIVLGLATEQRLNWLAVLRICGGAVLLIAFSLTLGRKLVHKVAGWINRSKLPKPGAILTFIVLLGGLFAIISQAIGIHAALGFFFAGVMAGDTHEISENTRQTITQTMYAVFVPLFFISIGLRLDFVANFNLLAVLSITAVAIGGKLVGAWAGARLSGIRGHDSIAIGVVFIPGGAMEILIGVLALEFGLINLVLFEAIVVAAIVSSILVGPLLSIVLRLRKAFNTLEYFLPQAVISELSGDTPQELIGELCSSISDQDQMPQAEPACALVMDREEIIGTGMEKGIAIPHARLPDLTEPVFTFGRSLKGIDWNTPDGLPVKLVFLLLSPVHEKDKADVQVNILASIARVMSDHRIRKQMLDAPDREGMLRVFEAALRRDRMRHAGRR
ncbi:hypothetical protein GF359_00125 [candidate division WOR-3 bacterium]|uniref:PTS EIIA type-2 domain-containing protein n=1 Tax=candidate division WOR-3 bacterium TaxID=2052148 RepID=A0A9D5QD06_UNCW3|nr:hypothetical protein [candidate division WOR-3 bacterium]MBD3363600.1 hypothetical protein [candidate division WOR-3 bacterium]